MSISYAVVKFISSRNRHQNITPFVQNVNKASKSRCVAATYIHQPKNSKVKNTRRVSEPQ